MTNTTTPFRKFHVVYHDYCMDGLMSAAIIDNALVDKLGHTVTYQACAYAGGYKYPIESIDKDTCVIFADYFVADLNVIRRMCQDAGAVLVLDHHESAAIFYKENMASIPRNLYWNGCFNNEKCGAMLCAEYFYPETPIPPVIKLVDDRDRWVWKYPDSRPFSAAAKLRFLDAKFDSQQDRINAAKRCFLDQSYVNSLMREGSALVAYQNNLCEAMLRTAKHYEIEYAIEEDGDTVLCKQHVVDLGDVPDLPSEVCSAALTRFPSADLAACYLTSPDGLRTGSLRSRRGSDVNVRQIAKLVGGGGHANASGFPLNSVDTLTTTKPDSVYEV